LRVVKALELIYFDKNGLTFNMDRILCNSLSGWASASLAGGYIKPRAVPGTGNDSAIQPPFGQRASAVGTAIANSVKQTLYVKQGDVVPFGSNQFALAGS
jgi:hypothetical protein